MREKPKVPESGRYGFSELYKIVEELRAPGGCPWDREQTHESLVRPMLEEALEAIDAIRKDDRDKIVEELGDVLLQVIFHSVIAEEAGEFTYEDITDRCSRKMIGRHVHIFGEEKADTPSEALSNWDAAKLKEKGFTSLSQDLEDIPKVFPALMRAEKAAKKIRKAGRHNETRGDIGEDSIVGIDFGDPDKVGALLYEICRRAEEKGVKCEEALRDATDGIIAKMKDA
ncbi:MAG: MazG family protein [Clostridia bacterium]|nr:MazG family protein [Clostridia bacterium]